MEIFPLFQARLMLLCCLLGVLTGLVFDFFRTISNGIGKRLHSLSYVIIVMGDILTVAFMGVSVTVLCFYYNKGIVRFFCIFGLALGLAFYFFVFSRIILKIYTLFFKAILFIFLIILRPILKIIKKTQRNLQIVLYYTLKTIAKWGFWVYNIYVKRYVIRKSEKGFLKMRKRRRRL